MKKLISTIMIMIAGSLCLLSTIAHANLQSGSVTNLSGNNISASNPTSVTVRWSMQSFGITGLFPGPVISSATGEFLDVVGNPIGKNNKLLSKTIAPTIAPSVVNITETFSIPRNVLFTASKLGLTQIVYRRTFTDCPGDMCNILTPDLSITLNLTGTAGSSFSVTNYKLRFANDQVAVVVQQNDELKAKALINVTRTGNIRGVWEVATPATTAGLPSFKVIKTIQRQLNSIKTSQVNSPLLPTDATGIYLVRFRFIDPALDGELPMLRYHVTATGAEKKVKLLSPSDGASLAPDTVFKWEPMAGASAYKLEIIELPAGQVPSVTDHYKVSTGLLLKADDAETQINKSVAQHLKPGKQYWWHVVGLNPSGTSVGETNWASIKVE